MSVQHPILRSRRQTDVLTAEGQTTFGPFDWMIFAVDDVTIRVKPPGATGWLLLGAGDYTVTLSGAAPNLFTLTLAAARPSGSLVRISGTLQAERSTDVTRAGTIRSVPLETEFDRIVVALQELRRDADEALAPEAAAAIAAEVVAQATTVIRDIKDETIAARNETIAVKDEAVEAVIEIGDLVAAAEQARADAQAAEAGAVAHDASAAVHDSSAEAFAALAAGYAAALGLIIDYGFVADAPTETRDYGSIA